jgi:hypothetical protein
MSKESIKNACLKSELPFLDLMCATNTTPFSFLRELASYAKTMHEFIALENWGGVPDSNSDQSHP